MSATCTASATGRHRESSALRACPACTPRPVDSPTSEFGLPSPRSARPLPRETLEWLSSGRLARFLESVGDGHHPFLVGFARVSRERGHPALPWGPVAAPLRVGFDIDEVLYDWTARFRDHMVEREGFSREQCGPRRAYDGLVEEWGFADHGHFVDAMTRAEHAGVNVVGPPKPLSAAVTVQIAEEGHQVHLVSARAPHGGRTHAETAEWLTTHGIAFDSLTISRDKTSVPVDLFIDDKPGNCDEIAASGTLAVMMADTFNEDVDHHLRVESLAVWGSIVESFSRWRSSR